jgi:hypothetical protein
MWIAVLISEIGWGMGAPAVPVPGDFWKLPASATHLIACCWSSGLGLEPPRA